jgi:hypothetical protein
MIVNRILNASFVIGAASRLTATYITVNDLLFLAGITYLSSVSKYNFSLIIINLAIVYLSGYLIDAVQILRSIPRAKDAVLRLKLVGMISTSEDSTK